MRDPSSLGPIWVVACALCFTTGCPEMLEDDFDPTLEGGLGGSAGTGGTGGTGDAAAGGSESCDSAPGGCGGSAGGGDVADSGAAPQDVCGSGGMLGPTGTCYAPGSTETSWSDARESCRARGADWDLATIRNVAENDYVLSITGFEAWIGATDGANEGTWLWVGDSDPFFEVGGGNLPGEPSYTNWNTNEPNDADGSDCLRILTTGLWADWACDSAKGYVCQRSAP